MRCRRRTGGMIRVRVVRVRLIESKFNGSWVVLFVWAFLDLFFLSRTFVLELVSKYMAS